MDMPDHHSSLHLRNFTAFENVEFEFCPGINVLVGTNGTGKTHVLKCLYTKHLLESPVDAAPRPWESVFQVDSENSLVRNQAKNGIGEIRGVFRSQSWTREFRRLSPQEFGLQPVDFKTHTSASIPVFIPAVDMMGHTRGFVSTYDAYRIDFDLTHRNIVSLLLAPEPRNPPQNVASLGYLKDCLNGDIVLDGERFLLKTKSGLQPFPAIGEGLRKVATLTHLVAKGFLQPGSTLYWDEPETNLNPSLMDEIVKALWDLSGAGVQVFLTSHSYLILKELETARTDGQELRLFALDVTKAHGVIVKPAHSYLELTPNMIEMQYADVYNRSIQKELDQMEPTGTREED